MDNRELAFKIIDALDLELYGDDYYKVEDIITNILDGKDYEKVSLPYCKMYFRQEVRDYLESRQELDINEYNYVDAYDEEDVEEICDKLMDNDYIVDMERLMDVCDDYIHYVIHEREEYKQMIEENTSVNDYLDVVLEDDGTETGGVAFNGEMLRDFLDNEECEEVKNIKQANELLKSCGIKPIEVV